MRRFPAAGVALAPQAAIAALFGKILFHRETPPIFVPFHFVELVDMHEPNGRMIADADEARRPDNEETDRVESRSRKSGAKDGAGQERAMLQ